MATKGRPALDVVLSEDERNALQAWAGGTASRELALRSRILLACAAGKTNLAVAKELGTTPQTVGKWRSRFLRAGLQGLEDEGRPGAPRRIGAEVIERIVARTVEDRPEDGSRWSTRLLARETGVSPSTVHRIWRALGQPGVAGSPPPGPGPATPRAGAARRRDAERTRNEILEVATREFADRGYSGGRVDEIASRTRTTKRMIYYYFGSKERLWIAVLERAYARIRAAEQELDVDHLEPRAAMRRLVEVTFDHHEAHPDFIRLVSIENIHHAEHMAKFASLANLNSPAIELISRILDRGYASGVFRRRVEAVDVHLLISAFCFFRVANRHTFGTLFGRDLVDPSRRDHYRRMLADVVDEYLAT